MFRVVGHAEAANHAYVGEVASVRADDIGIDFGAFKAKAAGARKAAAGEVDVYLDSLLVLSSLGEGSASPFTQIRLTSTDPMLHVVPAGETDLSQAMLVKELSLSDGEGDAFSLPTSYFLVLTETDALVVRDAQSASSDEGMVSFAVVHSAPALGTVDVHHADLGALTLQAGDATGYGDVAPGHHVIELRESGSSTVLDSYTFDWTASAGMSFVIVLTDAPSGTALQAVAADGTVLEAAESTQHESVALPERITLYTNYPNPFNPTTTISYSLPIADEVRVEVFDALGRQVALLADGIRQAGRHEVRFNADGLPSGMYVYRLSTSAHVEARPMVVLK